MELERRNAITFTPSIYLGDEPISDQRLIELWIARVRSAGTRDNYRRIAKAFLANVQKPLASINYGDCVQWLTSLTDADSTRRVKVLTIKSLFSFAAQSGYLRFNPIAPIHTPAIQDTLHERILGEAQILAIVHDPNLTMIERRLVHLLYYTGARVSEATGLHWRDLNHGILTLHGKGNKTRSIKLQAWFADELEADRQDSNTPMLPTRTKRTITRQFAGRLVKRIGKRHGLPQLSPHWFRHCHASHSLDRGAPISLVQATLGHTNVATTGRYIHVRPNDSSGLYLV